MTRRLARLALLAAGFSSIAGCSLPPNPIVARDPIPQPPPGYKVVCASRPFILNAYFTNCTPVLVPLEVDQRTVVRVKG
jgi:hypothetical protein